MDVLISLIAIFFAILICVFGFIYKELDKEINRQAEEIRRIKQVLKGYRDIEAL